MNVYDPPRKLIELPTWDEFLNYIRDHYSQRKPGEYLFRGEVDESWTLSTTLERYTEGKEYPFAEYYERIYRVQPELQTSTGQTWRLVSPDKYQEWLRKQNRVPDRDAVDPEYPDFSYMIFLRQHGFPSPLLDWTDSPYVAAFFAFKDSLSRSERASVYVFREGATNLNTTSPNIERLPPFLGRTLRHFRQQSWYTICVQKVDNSWQFVPHATVLNWEDGEQDVLTKITLPSAERMKALEYLDQYNLNAYSLFGSEDSLMHTMAFKHLR